MKATAPPRRSALPVMIGIDPSLNGTGVCIRGPRGEYYTHRIEPPKGCVGVSRLAFLRTILDNLVVGYNPTLAVIEGYAMGAHSRREAMGEWGGVLRVALMDGNVQELITVPPSTLKKWVIGHAKPGQCGKEIMLLKTFQKWNRSFDDSDTCDAFCLVKAGEAIWTGSGDASGVLQKAEREKISVSN
jgi:Holliday junction resolvasome RuvABC endonuclease subunit